MKYKEQIIVKSDSPTVFTASKAIAIYPDYQCTTYVFDCPKRASRWFQWVIRKVGQMPNVTYNFQFKNNKE